MELTPKKTLKVRVTLLEEMLGMTPADPAIYEKYIGSLAPDAQSTEDEVAAVGVDEVLSNQMTIFPKNAAGQPIMWDYQWRGFFKDAVGMLRRISGSECKKLTAYKKVIDGLLFIHPRQVVIQPSGKLENCQRPLRTSSASGDRTALAISETVPAGSTMDFEIAMMADDMEGWVRECLDYGTLRGLGQWRNSGKGTFTYEVLA